MYLHIECSVTALLPAAWSILQGLLHHASARSGTPVFSVLPPWLLVAILTIDDPTATCWTSIAVLTGDQRLLAWHRVQSTEPLPKDQNEMGIITSLTQTQPALEVNEAWSGATSIYNIPSGCLRNRHTTWLCWSNSCQLLYHNVRCSAQRADAGPKLAPQPNSPTRIMQLSQALDLALLDCIVETLYW